MGTGVGESWTPTRGRREEAAAKVFGHPAGEQKRETGVRGSRTPIKAEKWGEGWPGGSDTHQRGDGCPGGSDTHWGKGGGRRLSGGVGQPSQVMINYGGMVMDRDGGDDGGQSPSFFPCKLPIDRQRGWYAM